MPIQRRNRKTERMEWFGRVTLPDGKRKERKFPTKAKALEWEVLIRQKLCEISKRTPKVSLHSLMTSHLQAIKAKGISPGTYRDKKLVLKALLGFPGVSPVMGADELEHDVVRRFLDEIAQSVSGHRANTYLKHIKRMWNWGKRARIVDGECPWDIERYKEERSDKYVPPEDDFWAVYDLMPKVPTSYSRTRGHFVMEPHRQRMMLAYLHTGARKSEVFNLRWDDVDFKRARVRLWTRKRDGGLEFDWIPMTEQLADTLQEQRLETGFGEHVFVNPKTKKPYINCDLMIKRVCDRAGVREFSFHAIRHLTASLLLKAGVDLATIQLILRHRSITTTARYIHSLTDASEAINSAFGGQVIAMEKVSGE